MFNSHLKESIKKLYISSKNTSYSQFSFTQIESLPSPVQRYFRYSLNQGQHYISDARLIHDGEFRQNEHQKWMPIRGEEYFSTEQPGFVWLGKIQLLPFIWITGLDELIDGQGKFQIKLMSHITIAEAPKGRKLDEGELMRWLGETPLFPTALLPSKYLKWEDVDSNSSKAVVNYDELAVNLIFYFNESGEIIKMEGNRYRSINDSYVKEKWVGYYSNYTKIENMMVPLALEVAWNTQAGIFSYAKFNIKEIFDNFQKY